MMSQNKFLLSKLFIFSRTKIELCQFSQLNEIKFIQFINYFCQFFIFKFALFLCFFCLNFFVRPKSAIKANQYFYIFDIMSKSRMLNTQLNSLTMNNIGRLGFIYKSIPLQKQKKIKNTMSMVQGSKGPLCKFINNCRQFKQTKQCKFRHDRCRFQQKCQDKFNCKFYHPQIQGSLQAKSKQPKPVSKSKVSEVACKFGKFCKKKQQGNCPYNHDNSSSIGCKFGKNCQRKLYGKCLFNHDIDPPPGQKIIPYQNSISSISSIPAVMKQCKFGTKCKNFQLGACPFRHVESNNGDKSSKIPNQQIKTQINTQKFTPVPQAQTQQQQDQQLQDNSYYNGQLQEFEANKICQNYAIGCCKFQQCNKLHQLTLDNSLKRLFIKKYNRTQNLQIRMTKINQCRVFVIGKEKSIGFFQLDQEFQVLKSVCNWQMETQDLIMYLAVINNKKDESNPFTIIHTTQNNKLHKFHLSLGTTQEKQYGNSASITGIISFLDDNLLLVGNRRSSLTIENHQEKNNQFNMKYRQELNNVCFVKEFQILGENFFVFGTETGSIQFVNKNLDISAIKIPNSIPLDLCATKLSSKPFAFVVTQFNQNQSRILGINLLDLTWSVVLSYPLSKISKICVVHDRIFVGIDNNGVLVYQLPDFRKIKGRIPIKGIIHHMEGDSDGNLLLHEINPPNSIVSIYKVRK